MIANRTLQGISLAAELVGAAVTAPTLTARPAQAQAVDLVVVDIAAVHAGYRASKLINSNVLNDKNEKIGTLDDIVIGHDHAAMFAILQVGGFLGIGGKLVVVPYDKLNIDEAGTKIVLPGATKDNLKKAPEFHYT